MADEKKDSGWFPKDSEKHIEKGADKGAFNKGERSSNEDKSTPNLSGGNDQYISKPKISQDTGSTTQQGTDNAES